jgi:serine protease
MVYGKFSGFRLVGVGALVGTTAAVILLTSIPFVSNVFADQELKTFDGLYGAGRTEEFVPGELIVWFDAKIAKSDAYVSVKRMGGEIVKRSAVTPTRMLVSVPEGEEDASLRSYGAMEAVSGVEKNYIYHALWAPNDSFYKHQWHYNKEKFIYAEEGWDVQRGDPGVVVAVIDTGVAYEKFAVPPNEQAEVAGSTYARAPDLAGTHFVPGYDFVHGDEHPNDQNGHGTHVAGTIAQTTDNGADVAGLSHKCSVMPIQVLDYTGSGTAFNVAEGIDFARINGAEVINMSLGGPAMSSVIKTACDDAEAAGIVVLAASGNDGLGAIGYPAGYDSVVAVGAVDFKGELAYYSNYGQGQELVAPGGDVRVDESGDGYPDGVLQMTYDQLYREGPPEVLTNVTTFANYFFQGTSMACPHAAALAALIVANGVTDNDAVRQKLRETATDLGTTGFDVKYGYGLINCKAALRPTGRGDTGKCGACSKAEAAAFLGLWAVSYGIIYWRRRSKSGR